MSVDISKVQDPVLREIYSMGFVSVLIDNAMDEIKLMSTNGSTKRINQFEFRNMMATIRFKTGILYDGSKYTWIQESDGSADRFRKFILK